MQSEKLLQQEYIIQNDNSPDGDTSKDTHIFEISTKLFKYIKTVTIQN